MNRVYHENDIIEKPKRNEELFLNAEDLYYDRKYASKRRNKMDLLNNSQMRGAFIVSSSRELLNQIYSLIRRLDVTNTLSVNRVGSSVQLFSPIVEHLTMGSDFRNKRELMTREIDTVSVKNLVNNANWNLNDIMLVTPMVLKFLLDDMRRYDPYGLNPSIIALDEFDLLFTNPGMEDPMLQILRKFGGTRDSLFAGFNERRQFILSSSTIPRYIQGRKSLDFLVSSFNNLNIIKGDKFNAVNKKLDTHWVQLEDLRCSPEKYLLKLIKQDLDENYNTIVF